MKKNSSTTKIVASGKTHPKKRRKRPVQHKKQATVHKPKREIWTYIVGAVIVAAVCILLYIILFSSKSSKNYLDMIPHGYTVHGIDVSHHQGIIDWELLRNQAVIDGQPLSFVFIKATEGDDFVDNQFSHNIEQARKYGILCGAYHFFQPSISAKKQAELFIRQVQLKQGDLPPVLDVEVKPGDVSQEDFRQGILEWLLRVEQHYHVKPILYTYHSFHQQYMSDSIFNLYPYWIAHYYVDSVRYQGPWAFWQHNDKGQLPGIKEDVDLNIFRGSFEELQQLTIGN
jgi:lysozyme